MERGDRIAQRFEIERLAGSGGMGDVYRALDHRTGCHVAVKLMQGDDREVARRFAQEATLLEELVHPGVVRHVAHGVSEAGRLYLAMEWLDGEDLGQRLEREGLSMADSLRLVARAADAVGAAHERGIVHRDLKPSNLFLVDGAVDALRVLDFGVAHQGASTLAATGTGTLLGTPAYMAPEQARGERAIDARADVYALGAVLFECLTGRTPFVSESIMGLLAKVLLEEAPRLHTLVPDVPAALDALVARMLAKEPEGRPRDGRTLAQELAALGELDHDARPSPSAPPSAITGREQRLLCVILAGAAARGDGLAGSGEDGADTPADLDPASMAKTMTPEEATGELDALRVATARFDARVELLLDGSVLATLSSSGVATDQAARAARCALALRAILPDAPMALATGRGVMGARWPVGEVIEGAASLLAAPEEAPRLSGTIAKAVIAGLRPIRIDETTGGLLDGRFEVGGDTRGLELRGERETVDAERRVLGKEVPCIGRDRELAALHEELERCIFEPMAQATLVTAAAGVGKSRLAREFVEEARRRHDLEVWIARGDPTAAGTPLGLLSEAIRRTAGVVDGEPLDVKRQKLRARVRRTLGGDAADRVTDFLGELVAVPFPDEDRVELRAARRDAMLLNDQMRRAFEDWLDAESAAQPVLIVLEDLHWGDLPSVRFLDSALRRLPDRPWMVLALARPDVRQVFPHLWAERGLHEVRLGELTKKGSEALVRRVLGDGLAPERVRRLVELAAGNAFYLEELIRSVAARGEDDTAEPPGTVLAMVQARLEGLEGEARRVLRAASVFGQVFWRGGVLALLGGSERTTQGGGWLSELVQRELIERRRESNFPGEEEYTFRHALVRDAAYATLTEADRAVGHRLAGQWLERAGALDPNVLADHLERGGDPRAAVTWYRRAAQQAFRGNDFEGALRRADKAIACAGQGPAPRASVPAASSRISAILAPRAARTLIQGQAPAPPPPSADDETIGELLLLSAEAHKWRGQFGEAEARAREAMDKLPAGSPPWFAASGELALASGRVGRRDTLAQLGVDLTARARTRAPSPMQVVASARVAVELFVAGLVDLGDDLLDAIEDASGEVAEREPAVAARLAGARSWRALMAGDPAGYLRLEQEAALAYERAGDVRNACLARANAGYAAVEMGAYADAEQSLRETLAAAEKMGLSAIAAGARQHLGRALGMRGIVAEAREVQREALRVFTDQGHRRMEAGSRIHLAELALCEGDLAGAEDEARRAVEAAARVPATRAYALAALARVLLRERPSEARAAAKEAMDTLGSLGGVEDGEALVRLVYAQALRATGDAAGARGAIEAARARLLGRATKIQDAAFRASFLERVPENARTLALADAWCG